MSQRRYRKAISLFVPNKHFPLLAELAPRPPLPRPVPTASRRPGHSGPSSRPAVSPFSTQCTVGTEPGGGCEGRPRLHRLAGRAGRAGTGPWAIGRASGHESLGALSQLPLPAGREPAVPPALPSGRTIGLRFGVPTASHGGRTEGQPQPCRRAGRRGSVYWSLR